MLSEEDHSSTPLSIWKDEPEAVSMVTEDRLFASFLRAGKPSAN
jgi:hypothetical protein